MEKDKTQKSGKKGISLISIILIQAAVIVYTGSSVCNKLAGIAGNSSGSFELLGHQFGGLFGMRLFWVFMAVVCLGIYAVIWQQIIKHFDLSIVYANRAFAVCWTFLWGVLLFGEAVKPLNLVGIVIVLAGILLVNSDAK
ncbi:MAG: hypothetical protein Q4B09_05210 [Lachnospiraceae bacterium]|nr:hypothetical protein [Lachnospiraceae bacterium]